jgi:hypothetical protein
LTPKAIYFIRSAIPRKLIAEAILGEAVPHWSFEGFEGFFRFIGWKVANGHIGEGSSKGLKFGRSLLIQL